MNILSIFNARNYCFSRRPRENTEEGGHPVSSYKCSNSVCPTSLWWGQWCQMLHGMLGTVPTMKKCQLMTVPRTTRRSSQPIVKEINPEYWKDWCWNWSSNIWPPWFEEPTHCKRPWYLERLRATEDEMVGRHHWLNGYEFEQTQGNNEG